MSDVDNKSEQSDASWENIESAKPANVGFGLVPVFSQLFGATPSPAALLPSETASIVVPPTSESAAQEYAEIGRELTDQKGRELSEAGHISHIDALIQAARKRLQSTDAPINVETALEYATGQAPDGQEAWYVRLQTALVAQFKQTPDSGIPVSLISPREFEEARLYFNSLGHVTDTITEFVTIPADEMEVLRTEMSKTANLERKELQRVAKQTPGQKARFQYVKQMAADVKRLVSVSMGQYHADKKLRTTLARMNMPLIQPIALGAAAASAYVLASESYKTATTIYGEAGTVVADALFASAHFFSIDEEKALRKLYQEEKVTETEIMCAAYRDFSAKMKECALALEDVERKTEATPEYKRVLKVFADFSAQRSVNIGDLDSLLGKDAKSETWVGMFTNLFDNTKAAFYGDGEEEKEEESRTSDSAKAIRTTTQMRGILRYFNSKAGKEMTDAVMNPVETIKKAAQTITKSMDLATLTVEDAAALLIKGFVATGSFKCMMFWYDLFDRCGEIPLKACLLILAFFVDTILVELQMSKTKNPVRKVLKYFATPFLATAIAAVPAFTLYLLSTRRRHEEVEFLNLAFYTLFQSVQLAISTALAYNTDGILQSLGKQLDATRRVATGQKTADFTTFSIPTIAATKSNLKDADAFVAYMNIQAVTATPFTFQREFKAIPSDPKNHNFVAVMHTEETLSRPFSEIDALNKLLKKRKSAQAPLLVFHVFCPADTVKLGDVVIERNSEMTIADVKEYLLQQQQQSHEEADDAQDQEESEEVTRLQALMDDLKFPVYTNGDRVFHAPTVFVKNTCLEAYATISSLVQEEDVLREELKRDNKYRSVYQHKKNKMLQDEQLAELDHTQLIEASEKKDV